MKRAIISFLSFSLKTKINNLNSASYSQLCRSYMYVPGDSLKMLNKIISLNGSQSPDIAIFDLEDSVDIGNKDLARNNIFSIIKSPNFQEKNKLPICIRVNATSFDDILPKDVDLISECLKASNYKYPKMVNLCKVENMNDVEILDSLLKKKIDVSRLENPIQLGVMIESCAGITRLHELFQHFTSTKLSCFKLHHSVFGSDDYCATIGVSRSLSNHEVLYARQHFINVTRTYKIIPIDMVEININDENALEQNCKFGMSIGFAGKQVIHPKQVAIVNQCFSPSEDKFKWATELLKEFEIKKSQKIGAFKFQGRMIDTPSIIQAQNLVEISKLIATKNECSEK